MGVFDKWFKSSKSETVVEVPSFGRYSDANKTQKQYEHWEKALVSFEKEEYVESIANFLPYLKDEVADNVIWDRADDSIRFHFFQGSRRINAVIDDKSFRAEVCIARTKSLNVGLLRRLVEKNYKLNYSRFALDQDNNIMIVFTSALIDASPYKIYYGLKEIAVHADKLDDILMDEFENLHPIEDGLKRHLSEREKEVKYRFVNDQITNVLNTIQQGSLDPQQFPGAISYQLLDLCYRIDYLVKPEGYLMDALERIHRIYFSSAEPALSLMEKNNSITSEYNTILARSKAQVDREIYSVVSTFGVTHPFSFEQINTYIDGELKNVSWYLENKFPHIVDAICGYIVGFLLFNYALPLPVRSFFHLYFQIIYNQYFIDLGVAQDVVYLKDGKLNAKAVKKAIEQIIVEHKTTYKSLNFTGQLNFEDTSVFSYSFLGMVRGLDFRK